MNTKTTLSNFTTRVAMTLVVLLFSSLYAWADLSGRCGTNLLFYFHSSSNTVDIYIGTEGTTGYMTNYNQADQVPWKSVRGQIEKVIIGEGVTGIGNYAFYGCSALRIVEIASTVTNIGNSAFQNCTSLESIDIPDNVTRIGNSAFSNCWRLSSISLPDNMVTIEDFAFESCKALTSFSFPTGVENISKGVFKNCAKLTSFTIPVGVTSIGQNAFGGCTGLKDITIPNSVESIGNRAFQDCKSLDGVTIPNSVTGIGDHAFSGCSSLESVTFDEDSKLESISTGVFCWCEKLKEIDIPYGVKSIGQSAFDGCTSLTNVTFPEGVKSIGQDAFCGCTSLTNVTFPEGVKTIGEQAFQFCESLTSVTIPNSVTSIGSYAFYCCSSLTSVYCYAISPPELTQKYNYYVDEYGDEQYLIIGSHFDVNASDRKIYVPEACLTAYKDSWSDYRDDIVGTSLYTITLAVSPDETFGTASVSTTVAGQGDQVTLTAIPKPGYRFLWWNASGGAVVAKPSAQHTTLTMPKRDITLTAKFHVTDDNPDTYTLTLDINEGDPMGTAEIHEGIKSYTLPTFTRTGYYFLGWATSATGDPAYKAGETLTLANNLTLYASWLPTPVELADNAPNVKTLTKLMELNAIDVKLKNRSLVKDGYWNTLCLPFSLTSLDGTPLSGATLMELDTKGTYDGRQTGFDASTGTLYLYFKPAESIEAGKPYIIKWGTPNPSAAVDAIFNPIFNGVKVTTYAPSAVSSIDGSVSFTGIYAPVSFGEKGRSSLFMGESNTIYYFGPNAYLNAFRAYFRLADDLYAADVSEGNEVKAFVLNFGGDDEVTGIESIEDLNIYDLRFDADGWYDLAGRRLNGKPSIPGIYINNGSKIIIK